MYVSSYFRCQRTTTAGMRGDDLQPDSMFSYLVEDHRWDPQSALGSSTGCASSRGITLFGNAHVSNAKPRPALAHAWSVPRATIPGRSDDRFQASASR